MNQFKEEMNVFVLSIEQPLEQNLYYLDKALRNTSYQLIIEIVGQSQNKNYDTIMSYLLIFYNYINYVKREDPFFEGIIRLPNILNYDSCIEENKYETIFVSEHNKQIPQSTILTYTQDENNVEIIKEIKRYLDEDVQKYVQIIQGKIEGSYPKTQIQSLERVVLGGTYDHLHYGHKVILSGALLLAIPNKTQVTLGLTGSELLKNKKNKELLQSYEARKKKVEYFQQVFTPQTKFNIFELMEPMGPLRDKEFDGLVISHETLQSSLGINKFRKENGLSEIPLYIVEVICQSKSQCGNDFTEKASSTYVRNYLLEKNNLTCEQVGYLYTKWVSIFTNYNENSAILNHWFDKLKLKYSESQRYYHTLSHIYQMLLLSEQVQIHNSVNVQLAIWFHDVIYNPKRKDNEKRSADLYLVFDSELKNNNIIIGQSEVIAEYILITANHVGLYFDYNTQNDLNQGELSATIKNDEKLKQDLDTFLDIDLSILGQEQEVYDKYSKDIIKEYSHFTKEQIKVGRTQILNKFLQEQNLFKTKYFQDKLNEQVKKNIQREIEQLIQQ